MWKSRIKKIWIISIILLFSIIFFPHKTFAADGDLDVEWFNIMPELDDENFNNINKAIQEIWQTWWKVMDTYREKAEKLTVTEQITWWIMNRNTLLNYIVFLVQFLSQLWLVVWWWFIMYAWYKYMISVFNWWKVPSSTVKNAIIGIIIVIFSYAIMRTLTSIIWLT